VIPPGGGLTKDRQWKHTMPGFVAPVKLLSKLFRMEFERLIREQIRSESLPAAEDFRREFVCDVQSVGDGVATLKYLSRYVFRTAITNDRIESLRNGYVTFRYRRKGEHRDRRMRLPVFEFLRRFLQHVLPKGLHKARHYGFLSRCSKTDLESLRCAVLKKREDFDPDLQLEDWMPPVLVRLAEPGLRFPVCHHPLTFECFARIHPPPLEFRGRSPDLTTTRSESYQN
jgi:hypothetical protein